MALISHASPSSVQTWELQSADADTLSNWADKPQKLHNTNQFNRVLHANL